MARYPDKEREDSRQNRRPDPAPASGGEDKEENDRMMAALLKKMLNGDLE